MRTLMSTALIALAVAAAGCGGGTAATTSAPAATAPAGATKVAIRGFKYAPASLTVAAGTAVTFTNFDAAPHTASATGLDTGTLRQGQSRTVTLAKAGTYAYVCQFHPYMHGTIVVR
jgi:plastocyanin